MHWGCVGFARKGRTGDLGCSFLGPTNHSPSSTKKRHHRQKLFNIPAPGPAAPPASLSYAAVLFCYRKNARRHTYGRRAPPLSRRRLASRHRTTPSSHSAPLNPTPPHPSKVPIARSGGGCGVLIGLCLPRRHGALAADRVPRDDAVRARFVRDGHRAEAVLGVHLAMRVDLATESNACARPRDGYDSLCARCVCVCVC